MEPSNTVDVTTEMKSIGAVWVEVSLEVIRTVSQNYCNVLKLD